MSEDRPDFKIYLDGSPLDTKQISRVIQITVDNSLDQAALATIRFDWAADGDGNTFAAGVELKIDMGYVAKTETVFKGEITGLKGNFPRRGDPSLVVIAMDKMHRMRRSTCQASFLEQKDSEAISTVIGDAGLATGTIETSPLKLNNIMQWNQTPADFVLTRAKRCGMIVRTDNEGKISVEKPKLGDGAVATIEWHAALEHFSVAMSLANQQTELKASAWDMVKKERIEFSAKQGDESNLMGGTIPGSELIKTMSSSVTELPNVPASSPEEIELFAKSTFAQRSQDFVTGEGTCEGNPKILAGTVVEVEGIGPYLEGPYFVTQAIHTLHQERGYSTTFRVMRTAVKAPATVPANTAEGEGPAPQDHEVEPQNDPLSFKVSDPKDAALGGVPFVLASPDGKRKAGELSSDGKVEIEFEED